MTPLQFLQISVLPALAVLPERMDSPEARRMMVAIADQESNLEHRWQLGGPARGFYQFEKGGGHRGVMRHSATEEHARAATFALALDFDYDGLWDALPHSEALQGVWARLLLWTLPQALPTSPSDGWNQYIEAWRPGRPHPDRWARSWASGEAAIG